MSVKQIGFCRVTQSLVADTTILSLPWPQDDLDVYRLVNRGLWHVWRAEKQHYELVPEDEIPDIVKMGVMLL